MSARPGFRWLPHELFFGFFLILTWGRLVCATGFLGRDSLLYLVIIALNVICIRFCRSGESPRHWRLGLLFYPVAMNVIFTNMKTAIPKLSPECMDSALQRIDHAFIGTNLSLRLEPFVHPALTELFSLCYLLFFIYLLFSLIYFFAGEVELLKRFIVGLFTIYGIGFLGYSLVPAAGPCHAMAGQFAVPLTGWLVTGWNAAVVARGSNGVDVFPSLHCAVSSFFLFFDRRYRPWRFKLYLVPCLGLWLSTIYLRYHYLIDVLCGFALSALALWLAERFPSMSVRETIDSPSLQPTKQTSNDNPL